MQRRTKLILVAVIMAVLVGLLLWQENLIATLRARNQTLAAQIQAPDSLQVGSSESAAHANDAATQAATDRSELERLRAQTERMRTQLQAAQTARVAIARSAATPAMNRGPLPPGYISLRDAQDVGAATGESMMQTFMWAMRTADTNRIAGLLDASAEGAQQSLEQMLRSLPDAAARGEFERAEASMAFHIVREVPLPDGDTALVVEVSGPPDGAPDRKAVRTRRSGNEWRIVLGKHGPEEIQLTPEQMGN
jgi:hypothetical protein